MKNLVFVIWMICFPAIETILKIISHKVGLPKENFSSGVEGMAALIYIIIWFVIGSLLYER